MGDEIQSSAFSEADKKRFLMKLREETKVLKRWFDEETFDETREPILGLEVEGWLLDKDYLPAAKNEVFIDNLDSPLIVPELSKYNFELNAEPRKLTKSVFSDFLSDLNHTWNRCEQEAKRLGLKVFMGGTLPSLLEQHLNLEVLSSLNRYYMLNQQVLNLRKGKNLKLRIEGKTQSISLSRPDVLFEAAATALQTHIQVPVSKAAQYFNSAFVLSAPMVAVAANAPFLFGRELWCDTRIPLFEQAVEVLSFRDKHGDFVRRVTFGDRFIHHSLLEPFLDNLNSYRILLPSDMGDEIERLSPLRLHNGTIWRWNRPIIGFNDSGVPHLRLEHRVTSAGPTVLDTVANIALFVGMIEHFVSMKDNLEDQISFEQVRDNFYLAAKEGLDAEISWLGGEKLSIKELLLRDLIPSAKKALLSKGVDEQDVVSFLDEVITPRVSTGQTGAIWQKKAFRELGENFQSLVREYVERQQSGEAVHKW